MSKRKTNDGLTYLSGRVLKLTKTSLTDTATVSRNQTLPDGDGMLILEDAVNGLTLTKPLKIIAGTAAAPGLAIQGDSNTGIYSAGADTFNMTAGGGDIFRLTPTEVRARVALALESSPLRWTFNTINYNPNASYSTGIPGSTISACEFNQVNDNTTAAAATVHNRADYILGYKDVRATNTGINYTHSATLFVTGPPTHSVGTSTATNRYGIMTAGIIAAPNGSLTAPAYGHTNFTGTGRYALAGPQLAWSVNGVQRLLLTGSTFRTVGRLEIADGTLANPGIVFQGDTDCGIRRTANNVIAMTVGGGDVLTFTTTTSTFSSNIVAANTTLQVGNGGSNGTGTALKCIYSGNHDVSISIGAGSVATVTVPNVPLPFTFVERMVHATLFTGNPPNNWDRVLVTLLEKPTTNPGNLVFSLYNISGVATSGGCSLMYSVFVK